MARSAQVCVNSRSDRVQYIENFGLLQDRLLMATACDHDAIFRIFTACPHDVKTLILDVRHMKCHKRLHLNQSYSIRLASDGKTLVVRD